MDPGHRKEAFLSPANDAEIGLVKRSRARIGNDL